VSPDRRVFPEVTVGAEHAFLVQGARDGARPDAGGELAKDTAHDIGFGFIDLAVAADRPATRIELFHHLVAVAEPGADDRTAQPSGGRAEPQAEPVDRDDPAVA
jgi:hypothetical protein